MAGATDRFPSNGCTPDPACNVLGQFVEFRGESVLKHLRGGRSDNDTPSFRRLPPMTVLFFVFKLKEDDAS